VVQQNPQYEQKSRTVHASYNNDVRIHYAHNKQITFITGEIRAQKFVKTISKQGRYYLTSTTLLHSFLMFKHFTAYTHIL